MSFPFRRFASTLAACQLVLATAGCSSGSSETAKEPEITPGATELPGAAEQPGQERFAQLVEDVKAVEALDGAGLVARYPSPESAPLGYSPRDAEYLDRVQASALALTDAELEKLNESGVMISSRTSFPTFLRGYAAIYQEHLPVFVSADGLLDALHRSYDDMLLGFEQRFLRDELQQMLELMRADLAGKETAAQLRADADFYLAVALGLLTGELPADSGEASTVRAFMDAAEQAAGTESKTLFGVPRDIDFSQFTPRGHYTGDEGMERYFRAMMWLGRIDMRLLETRPDGTQFFNRPQFEVTLLFNELLQGEAKTRWQDVESVVAAFVGQSDYMRVPEVDLLVADLGGTEAARAASDEAVVKAIAAGGYGQQEIASHLMVNDGHVKTLPLNRSFAIFGQRYVVDSHVFSETVYDRVGDRLMPNPLDAAFAALGNNTALRFQPEVASLAEFPGALGRMRTLIDAHDGAFWDASFYNLWLGALRGLSPANDGMLPAGMPAVAKTQAWSERILNTQLASWAQLRHDTLLYAKQSFTGIPGCEFPDVYVDPYPAFFKALGDFAERGATLVDLAAKDEYFGKQIADYFDNLRTAADVLGGMAQRQLDGDPPTPDQLAYVNDAIRIDKEDVVCAMIDAPNGWYANLFFTRDDSIEMDPTIADVHTQPADWEGNPVGKVLHVATGLPRLMVTTIDTCVGPRAYVGMASAYHELITDDYKRLTDEEWSVQVMGAPADVAWLSDVLQ